VTLIATGLAVLLVAADFALFRLKRHLEERDHQAWREHADAAMQLANGGRR
jgi:hypothetical protein